VIPGGNPGGNARCGSVKSIQGQNRSQRRGTGNLKAGAYGSEAARRKGGGNEFQKNQHRQCQKKFLGREGRKSLQTGAREGRTYFQKKRRLKEMWGGKKAEQSLRQKKRGINREKEIKRSAVGGVGGVIM